MIKHGCKAYQASDQMFCPACNLTWDVSDPEPPVCRSSVQPDKVNPLTEAFDSIIKDNDPRDAKADNFTVDDNLAYQLDKSELRTLVNQKDGMYNIRGGSVAVVSEKLSPITTETVASVFQVDGTPAVQVRKTVRPNAEHTERRSFVQFDKRWTSWQTL